MIVASDQKRRDEHAELKYNLIMAGGGTNPRNKKWTAELVVAGLKAFFGRSSLTPPPSLELANPPLIGGARRVFGSLKAAMAASGLPYPPRPRLNETTLLEALRRMHAEGRDLSLAAVKDRRGGSLLGPALHLFGSWRKAVEAAGIDYSGVERIREWSRETVLEELRRRYNEGRDMGGGVVQKEDLRLNAAAKRHFGTYQSALDAAGIPAAQFAPEWTWSVSRLQQGLRDLHAAGADLSSSRVRQSHRDLFYAARKRLGSWRKAIESIGLDYDSIRRARDWSQQAIIDRLRELHQHGADLRTTSLQKSDIPLSGAVQRYFRTLRRALEAAGLPYPEDRSRTLGYWTEDLVLEALRDLNVQSHDLRHSSMKQKNQPLFYAAKKLFGSYSSAVLHAGINYWEMSQVQLKCEREARKQAGAGAAQAKAAAPAR